MAVFWGANPDGRTVGFEVQVLVSTRLLVTPNTLKTVIRSFTVKLLRWVHYHCVLWRGGTLGGQTTANLNAMNVPGRFERSLSEYFDYGFIFYPPNHVPSIKLNTSEMHAWWFQCSLFQRIQISKLGFTVLVLSNKMEMSLRPSSQYISSRQ